MGEEQNIVKFIPFESFVSPTFWHKLSEIKLDKDRLSDKPRTIYGCYTNRRPKSCLMEFDYTSFNRVTMEKLFVSPAGLSTVNNEYTPPPCYFRSHGIIYNKNTIEEFKTCDKNAILREEGIKLLNNFKNESILDDPSLLAKFLLISFADIKNHCFYYWFAFPCPLAPTLALEKPVSKMGDCDYTLEDIEEALKLCSYTHLPNFFILRATAVNRKFYTLREFIDSLELMENIPLTELYMCFCDNSEFLQPSWLMRIYAAFLYYKCPYLVGKTVRFLGLQYNSVMSSRIWEVKQSKVFDISDYDKIQFLGWELNEKQKAQPRMVSMKENMDKKILTENVVDLNLKLMKWRLLPDLNLEIIKNTKCLLLGAGTLGCAVARMLLGWGFKYITFADNGKVGLANPVRQYLYTFADAAKGNVMKSHAAAACLKEINPSTISDGHVIDIPMPGHTVSDSLKHQVEQNINKLQALVENHDAIFLLTDSRESRWLPALLGSAHNKIVINAALGFDSYLVQRHGSSKKPDYDAEDKVQTEVDNLKCIPGHQLGCYFCNDVSAPGNSLKDRTLDQQCTVTRPGVSNIAASYAVELLVSLLHHPLKELAPAYYADTSNLKLSSVKNVIPEDMLGILPHTIRGNLSTFENILPTSEKFTQCVACSEKVLNAFRTEGNDFLFKVFESGKYLEDLTGISEYADLDNEIIDYSDSD